MVNKFKVIVTNEILGNSEDVMTMERLEKFNKCALMCAKQCLKDGKSHSIGMWTVEPIDSTESEG